MSPDDRAHLMAKWWEHSQLSNGNRQQRKALSGGLPADAVAAYEVLADMVGARSEGVLLLLADLIDSGPADVGPSIVGTGPLEDLVHDHGDILIEELEALARRRPSFRTALASVDLEDGWVADRTAQRLRDLIEQ